MAKFKLGAEVKMQGMFLANPTKAIRIFEEEFKKALEESSALIQRDVIRGTPVHTGNLRNSIFREIRGRGFSLHAIIGTPVIYANWIETGKPAHFPNTENLKEWVSEKLEECRGKFTKEKLNRAEEVYSKLYDFRKDIINSL